MDTRSLQLLEELLVGHQLTENELDRLVNTKVKEDIYLEYKHGDDLLNNDSDRTLREYMSGFANSAGGVLIIGVEAPDGTPIQVTGCHGHKKGNLDGWASRCLTLIASYFSPLPQFQVLHHSKGDVLIGVTQRSLGLVPLVETGKIVYSLRLHDQTLKAPDYLMADLLLGRRQQPELDIVELRTTNLNRFLNIETDSMGVELIFHLEIGNKSLIWANDITWGLIAWVQDSALNDPSVVNTSKPSNHLLSYVEVPDVQQGLQPRSRQLLHFNGYISSAKPFEVRHLSFGFVLPLRIHTEWFSYTWQAALYLMTRNSLPIWFQISIVINADTAKLIDQKVQLTNTNGSIAVTRLTNNRPIVDWEGFIK